MAAVALDAIVAVVFFVTRDSKPSDEELIRAAVAAVDDAWNRSDLEALESHVYKEHLRDHALDEDDFQEAREEDGRLTSTVHSVKVTAGKATPNIEQKYENKDESDTNDIEFVRENGEWKYCPD